VSFQLYSDFLPSVFTYKIMNLNLKHIPDLIKIHYTSMYYYECIQNIAYKFYIKTIILNNYIFYLLYTELLLSEHTE
jgi:hypothetical protein